VGGEQRGYNTSAGHNTMTRDLAHRGRQNRAVRKGLKTEEEADSALTSVGANGTQPLKFSFNAVFTDAGQGHSGTLQELSVTSRDPLSPGTSGSHL
jgi:hypothetical protein